MVRNSDRIDTRCGCRFRVIEPLNPLHHQRTAPLSAQPLEIGECDARVERVLEQAHKVFARAEGLECERFGRHGIKQPVRLRRHRDEGAQGKRGRQRQPVVGIAKTRSGDRHVDGDNKRRISACFRAIQQFTAATVITRKIELEPKLGIRGF